ncbi:hypothetical protein FGO68_gene8781 [Halteria grandinella]|uniref:Uncharacterized protein n=1 Tax=Halteria grandinella TaxID=5974 RepID=A0A8J8NDM1_HALGN|nr:hypothetical protein FGO68_gene8781 [Halteria grandinella]
MPMTSQDRDLCSLASYSPRKKKVQASLNPSTIFYLGDKEHGKKHPRVHEPSILPEANLHPRLPHRSSPQACGNRIAATRYLHTRARQSYSSEEPGRLGVHKGADTRESECGGSGGLG